MSKNHYFNTRFWSDNWSSNLSSDEKLLLIYLLTNEKTSFCGVYEMPLRYMAMETGLEVKRVAEMLKAFEPQLYYRKGWVVLVNRLKHQNYRNMKIGKAIQNELCKIPADLFDLIKIPSDFDMDFTCPVEPTTVKSVDKDESSMSHLRDTSQLHYIKSNLIKSKSKQSPAKPDGLNKKNYAAAVRADEAQAQRDEKAAGRKGSTEPVNVTVRRQLTEKGILKS